MRVSLFLSLSRSREREKGGYFDDRGCASSVLILFDIFFHIVGSTTIILLSFVFRQTTLNNFATMKLSSLIFTAGVFATAVSAFSPAARHISSRVAVQQNGVSSSGRLSPLDMYGMGGGMGNAISLDEYTQRDVYAMEEWATNYGVQKMDGVELYTADGSDYQLIANQGIPAGSMVLYVPSSICLSSDGVIQEFGNNLQLSEDNLVQMDAGTAQRLPLFRLMVKILAEYEKGQDSAFFPWLNSLPRQFYNGVSMTKACFDCLPPYAGWLASTERHNYHMFVNAIRMGWIPVSPDIVNDDQVMMWAYNVALTRFHEIWEPSRQKLIAPMADMVSTIQALGGITIYHQCIELSVPSYTFEFSQYLFIHFTDKNTTKHANFRTCVVVQSRH